MDFCKAVFCLQSAYIVKFFLRSPRPGVPMLFLYGGYCHKYNIPRHSGHPLTWNLSL